MRLAGKRAVVLGAAAGNMGAAIARRFAAEGAGVTVAGRRLEPLDALAAEIGGRAMACDITRRADVEALAAAGPVDVAVNATGWGLLKGLHDITEDELDAMVALQFKGVHHFLSAFVRAMTRDGSAGGSIIQISSATVVAPVFDHAAYIGTKAGGEALVRAVAHQYGAQGVRANVIAPGITPSPMTAGAMAVPGLEAAFAERVPLGRVGTVDDVADAAAWLAGDAFVSGQVIQVNGGLTLRGNPLPQDVGASVAKASAYRD